MNKKQAFEYLASKYDKISGFVQKIEHQYMQEKGLYHQDITQDLYIKMYEEIERIESKPGEISKYLDRFYDGKTFKLYIIVKHMYIDLIRKEKKYISFRNALKWKPNTYAKLYENPVEFEMETKTRFSTQENKKSIEEKVDDQVESFTYFDKRLFNLYRYEFKTHTVNMSKETNLSLSTIYRTVKRCKIKINDKLRKRYYGK